MTNATVSLAKSASNVSATGSIGPRLAVKPETAEETLIGQVDRSYTDGFHQGDEAMSLPPITLPTGRSLVAGSHRSPAVAASAAPQPFSYEDELTLSIDAIGSDQAPAPGTLRAARLDRIKAEIDAGTYLTAEKLDAAIDNMIAGF